MCVCRDFSKATELCLLLSSCSAQGRLLLSLFLVLLLCLFLRRLWFSAACPAQVTLRGFRNLSGSSCLSCSCSGACCWVCGVLGASLGSLPLVLCSSSGACGWRCLPCRRLPLGVAAFSDAVCLTSCCAGGVGWAATLPFCCQLFCCAVWLAGVYWVLHPVSGSSHRGCDYLDECSSAFCLYLPLGLC